MNILNCCINKYKVDKGKIYKFNDKFYDELRLILKHVRFIIISGGEPFLNDEFYEFLVIEN